MCIAICKSIYVVYRINTIHKFLHLGIEILLYGGKQLACFIVGRFDSIATNDVQIYDGNKFLGNNNYIYFPR